MIYINYSMFVFIVFEIVAQTYLGSTFGLIIVKKNNDFGKIKII